VTDFGRGFYTTTNLDQAKNWARIRAARAGSTSVKGAVIAMDVSRDWLATLQCLSSCAMFRRRAIPISFVTVAAAGRRTDSQPTTMPCTVP
jgi:hypothetical protein